MSDSSLKPASLLKSVLAALAALYTVLDLPLLSSTSEIRRLVDGLVKSGTYLGMCHSKVMPIEPFVSLYMSWPDNLDLSLKDLRAKCISLLALTLMLRPSDIAPQGVHYDRDTQVTVQFVFHERQISFQPSGVTITFLGIKNDTSRSGFEVFLPRGSVDKLDPVSTLQCYMQRTNFMRQDAQGAVFLTLSKPYKALSASMIAQILCSMIDTVGLAGQGFTAKSFRPTGASTAVALGYDPDKVRRLGRWKTQSVFLEHYVHNNIDKSYVNKMLSMPRH